MSRVDFSTRAREDLRGIVRYVSQDKPIAAKNLVALLKDKCKLLGPFPEMGELREDIMPSLRAFSVGQFVIYYLPTGAGVRIERVVHGARDSDGHS
jgi:toxin ParE1/3/4